ncbi:MAG: DEAD/DEAH box helicase family protein, partial [Coraliomargaritaceae bacterium]
MSSKSNLLDGIISGLIESDPDVSPQYQPKLILNDYLKGTKTLEHITNNISSCESFILAVAFVTRSGVACVHQTLKEFGSRGGTGTILISTYLNFSDPSAIERLSKFEGIEVKFVNSPNFHGKTYLFEHSKHAGIMIGSSNLTQNALGKNTEANIGLCVARESSLYAELVEQLGMWSKKSDHITGDSLENYREVWKNSRKHAFAAREDIPPEVAIEWPTEKAGISPSNAIIPNLMQEQALDKLAHVREKRHTRSLIISATGTGKTVLSALDVRNFNAKKLLFVVHRLNICRKAMSEFKRVFGESRSMSIYCAEESLDKSADFVFSTVQTINKEHHLREFSADEFDYIIIDETHRAGAKTYQKIIDYFTPKFLLGMTATPERTDGFDIFSLFNHSVAYEIRLQNAMHAELLVPFHYFGVTDISVDGEPLDDDSDFNKLISEDRINHLINTLNEYGCDSGIPRGLIFCSKVEEARELSRSLNARGLRTLPLTGEDSADSRENAILKLESDDTDKLDYLITVDVFNEGVDIPRVNQVVMLRPTSSAIIFVQQLGRGLRKSVGKEYVTVIDFIGNYKNNYLIPVALFGDSSFSKDRLRKLLS